MKLYNKISNVLMALAAIVLLASCSSDDYERVGKPTNAQVYFSSMSKTQFLLEDNQNSIDVEVKRVKTEGALSVQVSATDESALFNVPATVSFADGETTALLNISFDFAKLTPNVDYTIKLKLDNETTIYGDDEQTISVKYSPWTEWEPMGWEYPDGISTYAEWETAFEQYRAGGYADMKLICKGTLPIFTYTALLEGSYYQPLHYRESLLEKDHAQLLLRAWANECDLVIDWDRSTNIFTVERQYTGLDHPTYGRVYATDAYTFWHDDWGEDIGRDYFNDYYDASNGQFVLSIAYVVEQGCIAWGYEKIQLPGFITSDYSVDITDEGSFANDDSYGEIFFFTLGSDVGSVKYTSFDYFLSSDEVKAKAQAIDAGEISAFETKESGYKVQMVTREGKYTLVVAVYDTDGEFVGYTSRQFTVETPSAYTWKPIGEGNYTYALFFATPENHETDMKLTLYECNEDPTKFKIAPWAYTDGFTFTMDAEGNVVVDSQPTGYWADQHGMVYVGDVSNYPELGEFKSLHEGNTFYFSLVYFLESGYLPDCVGYETFTVTGDAAKAVERAKAVAEAKTAAMASPTLPYLIAKPITRVEKFPTGVRRNHPRLEMNVNLGLIMNLEK